MKSWQELLMEHDAMLRQIAYSHPLEGAPMDDVLQELRLLAYETIKKFKTEKGNKLSTYLYLTCVKRLPTIHRKLVNRKIFYSLNEIMNDKGDEFINEIADEKTEKSELEEIAYAILLELPKGNISRRIFEGESQVEIANDLGVSNQAIHEVHQRNIKKVRERLKNEMLIK